MGYCTGQLVLGRDCQPSITSISPSPRWISDLTRGLEEVMNSETLELQAIFNADHMVSIFLLVCPNVIQSQEGLVRHVAHVIDDELEKAKRINN